MSYSDPDRDQRIADLQREVQELREQNRATHAMWRAGLKAAERGESREDIICALSGY
jgi:hypothetical protein